MEVIGTLKTKFETQKVSDRFQKREFVLTTEANTPYPQHVSFQVTQDKCPILDQFNDGEEIKVQFKVEIQAEIKGRGKGSHKGSDKSTDKSAAERLRSLKRKNGEKDFQSDNKLIFLHFDRQLCYIKQVLTHTEYDKGAWKK